MRNDHKVLWLDYRGAPQTVAVIKKSAVESQSKPVVRMLAEEVTKHLPSKDTVSEALAFYNLVLDRTRYMRDPRNVELVRAPWVVVDQIMAGHTPGLDCFPSGTLLLDERHRFVSIEDLEVGQKIWGRDRWSEVQAVAPKGARSVDTIFLNNGSQITATPEHKVYVRYFEHRTWSDGPSKNYVRIPVSELEPGAVMLSPEMVPGIRSKPRPILRVKGIERGVAELPVWDIQTDDHYVYLPEADTTVSNCDDLAALLCAFAAVSGAECRVVTVAFKNMFYQGRRQYSHVFAQIKEPRTGKWLTLDPVAGDSTQEMQRRTVAAKFWPVA